MNEFRKRLHEDLIANKVAKEYQLEVDEIRSRINDLREGIIAGRDSDGSLNPMIVAHLIAMLGDLWPTRS